MSVDHVQRYTKRQLEELAEEPAKNTTTWWRVTTDTFAHENHPVLASILGSDAGTFPLLSEDPLQPLEGECEEVKNLRESIANQLV